jgi:hypothetical protein
MGGRKCLRLGRGRSGRLSGDLCGLASPLTVHGRLRLGRGRGLRNERLGLLTAGRLRLRCFWSLPLRNPWQPLSVQGRGRMLPLGRGPERRGRRQIVSLPGQGMRDRRGLGR